MFPNEYKDCTDCDIRIVDGLNVFEGGRSRGVFEQTLWLGLWWWEQLQ